MSGAAIVRVYVVHTGLRDCNCALFPKLKTDIRSNCIGFEIAEMSFGCAVVRARDGTVDVVPAWIDSYGFAEVDRDGLALYGIVLSPVPGSVPDTHGPNSTIDAVRRGFGPPV